MKSRRVGLQRRLFLLVGGVVLAVFVIIVLFSRNRISTMARNNASEMATAVAEKNTSSASSFLSIGMNDAQNVANIFNGYLDYPVSERRTFFRRIIENVLKNNAKYTCVWCVWEPNVIDGMDSHFINSQGSNESGRYTPSWYRDGNGIAENIASEADINSGDYYKIPKSLNQQYVIEPHFESYSNEAKRFIISLCAPIRNESGSAIGVVGIDIALDELQSIVMNTGIPSAIFSNTGVVAAHFNKEKVGKDMLETELDMAAEDQLKVMASNIKEGNPTRMMGYSSTLNDKLLISVVPLRIGESKAAWGFATAVPETIALTEYRHTMAIFVSITVCALILLVIVLFYITRSITKPIKDGVRLAGAIASGDLTQKFEVMRNDEVGDLMIALNTMSEKLQNMIMNIAGSAIHISSASLQMSNTAQEMSQGATEQAASAEEVSSSMEEMSANIQQNTENAQGAENISLQGVAEIRKSNEAAMMSIAAMREIAEKVTVISDIAFQTNILALNAAVEAARAGDQGRGFAVVAAEVRKLAERSKVAADEIERITKKGVQISDEAGVILEKIVPEIEKTAMLVQEIAAASIEQNTNADQVNTALQQLNQITQHNAAAAEEMATSSEELASQAEHLKDIISFFKVDKRNNTTIKGVAASLKQYGTAKKAPVQTRKMNTSAPVEKVTSQGVAFKMHDSNGDSGYERF